MSKYIFESNFEDYVESFVVFADSLKDAWDEAEKHHRNIGNLKLVREL